MKKISILVQWLVILILAAVVTYIVWRPLPQPDYQPETWNTWEGLTVLSYAGIARRDQPDYPSVQRLEEHLTALHEAGYRTVRPEDVQAYLAGTAPLPSKALLLVFEGGRKEAFIRATPLLQRMGFTAVITVPTAYTRTWGGFYLKKSDLRRVVRLPQWQFGSMGHDAYDPIPTGPAGATGRFLANRRWLGDGQEDAAAFQERILQDYAHSARLLEEATGRAPLMFLYPFGDAGQQSGADPLAEPANRAGVTRHFGLAITGNGDPFNGPGRDPWSLTRLRVPGTWTGAELLKELDLNRPRRAGHEGFDRSADWVFERGGTLKAAALELGDGDVAWLRGTDGWGDVEIRATLSRGTNGIASVYARYGGPAAWLRLSLGGDGLRLQERLGARLQTIHRHPLGTAPDESRTVRLRLRNNRAWVWLDDTAVGVNLPLAPMLRRGRVGLGGEGGATKVSAFAANPLPARLVLANSLRLIPDEARPGVRAILPAWFKAGEAPDLAETRQQDLLLAAPAGIETIPMITGVETLKDDAAAAALANELDQAIAQASLKPLIRALAVDGPADALSAALRENGYRVVHVLTAGQALHQAPTLARVAYEDVVVIHETGAAAEQALSRLLHWIPASRVAVLDDAGEPLGPDVRTARMADERPGKE